MKCALTRSTAFFFQVRFHKRKLVAHGFRTRASRGNTFFHAGIEGYLFIEIVFEKLAEALIGLHRQGFEDLAALDTSSNDTADDLIRAAERHTLFREIIGKVCRVDEALARRFTHIIFLHLHRREHRREDVKTFLHGLDAVEYGFFILLQIGRASCRERV